jgi:hypothetical protein
MLAGFVASGFSTDRFNSREVERWRGRSNAELVEAVREPELSEIFRLTPAGALTEMVIHEQDVRRPLDIPRAYSEDCLLATLEATCTTPTGDGIEEARQGPATASDRRHVDAGWRS